MVNSDAALTRDCAMLERFERCRTIEAEKRARDKIDEALKREHQEDPDFPLPWRVERRVEYLHVLLCHEVFYLLLAIEHHQAAISRGDAFLMIFEKEVFEYLWQKVRRIRRELLELRRRLAGKQPDISGEMIQRARQFPFVELYEFRRNMAKCPFHSDTTPSMSLKNNRVRCWGACNRSWDTIAFIRERENLTFPQAVRRLQ